MQDLWIIGFIYQMFSKFEDLKGFKLVKVCIQLDDQMSGFCYTVRRNIMKL